MRTLVKSTAIFMVVALLVMACAISANADIKASAKTIKLGRKYSVSLPVKESKDYKIAVPVAGTITFSLEGYSSEGVFILYDANGAALDPTGATVTIGTGGKQSSRAVAFKWNGVSEKYAGTVTYKVDEGTYYCQIARNDVGVSVFKLELSFNDLNGNPVTSPDELASTTTTRKKRKVKVAEEPAATAARTETNESASARTETNVAYANTGGGRRQEIAVPQTSAQKYALVIGNKAYKSVSPLQNPVNDAMDMKDALERLGFQVDLVTDGSLAAMDEGVLRLKNRLSVSRDAYGFFFYSGHGVQSGGENYLIPVDADIRAEEALRYKALPMQYALDLMQSAGNALNIVILDACRNNPFSWTRSGGRGLAVAGHQPPGSIIVYSTSAGKTADDGTGRNGTFTTELLKNLREQDVEVKELFNRVGRDVGRATGGEQIPAIYSQFFEDAYLGSRP